MARGLLMAILALALAPAALAAAEPPAASAPKPSDELDEIVVRGARLYELRAAVVKAEDHFNAVYNQINDVDDFDIKCTQDTPTGTKLKSRYCRTRLEDRALSDEGRNFLEAVQSAAAGDTGAQPRGMNAEMVMMAREAEFEKNMVSLFNTHPELREAVKEYQDALQRYDRERVKRSKGRIFSFE